MRVRVEGDPNEVNSFVACMVAVTAAWGRPVSYDELAGLLGVAFSPPWNAEQATHWAVDGAADRRISFLGAALGFKVETLCVRASPDKSLRHRSEAFRVFDTNCELVRALCEGFEVGGTVLLKTWPSWAVVTRGSPRPEQVEFATLPWLEELTRALQGPERAELAYVLTPRPPTLAPREATLQAVRFGAFVARGAQADGRAGTLLGGACYDACGQRLRQPAFCSACPNDPATCAHRVLRLLNRSQRSGEVFLGLASSALRREVGEGPLTAARARYAELCNLTEKYLRLDSWKAVWRDRQFREAMAEEFEAMGSLQEDAARELARLV
jgi:hypothetical protein